MKTSTTAAFGEAATAALAARAATDDTPDEMYTAHDNSGDPAVPIVRFLLLVVLGRFRRGVPLFGLLTWWTPPPMILSMVAALGTAAVHQGGRLDVSPTITCDPNDAANCTCGGVPIGPDTWKLPSYMRANATSVYDLEVMKGGSATKLPRMKAAMIVNVASA